MDTCLCTRRERGLAKIVVICPSSAGSCAFGAYIPDTCDTLYVLVHMYRLLRTDTKSLDS